MAHQAEPVTPHADAEDKADERRGEDADPVFAVVAGVDEAEEQWK